MKWLSTIRRHYQAEFSACWHVFLIFFSAALLWRLWLSYQLDINWTLPIPGLIGDFLAAIAMTSCVIIIRGAHRFLAPVFVIFWAGLTIANGEHLYALNGPLRLENFQFATDGDFIRGTLFNLVAWPVAVSTVALAALAIYRLRQIKTQSLLLSILALALLGGSSTLSWRQALKAESWHQSSPLTLIVTRRQHIAGEPTALADTNIFFADEVNDAPPPEFGSKPERPNVLMVVLEGLPGIHLRQVQQASGVQAANPMPLFSAIAEQAYLVPDFVIHSQGTISGLYNLYCGDYSFFSSKDILKPMMVFTLKTADRPRCLPQILRDHGYHTTFLQAADIRYMTKDKFMPAIGFEEVLDKQEGDSDIGTFWGANDKVMLERVLAKIDELNAGDKPWFLSLLTVGTHHPFTAPPEYLERAGGNPKEAAVLYLDDALAAFYSALQARNVPDNTLIIFTSDESNGVPGHLLSTNWGLYAAIAPGLNPQIVPGIFGQIDVKNSVLDYLGLLEKTPKRIGRSVFRRYKQKRALLLQPYMLANGVMHRCDFTECTEYRLAGEKLFSPVYHTAIDSGNHSDLYWSAYNRAEQFYGQNTTGRQNLLLVDNQEWRGNRESIKKDITLPANSQIEVIMNIESIAAADYLLPTPRIQWIDASSDYRMDVAEPLLQLPPLPPGSRLVLSYSFYNDIRRSGRFLFSAFSRKDGSNGIRINKLKISSIAVPDAPLEAHRITKSEFIWDEGSSLSSQLASLYPGYEYDVAGNAYSKISQLENNRYAFVPTYSLGEKLVFDDLDNWKSLMYLAGDWHYPSKKGAISDGNEPGLAFRLSDRIKADARYQLQIRFAPYHDSSGLLGKKNKLTFWLNGHQLGSQTFTTGDITEGNINVSGEQLRRTNVFKIQVHNPFIPINLNINQDFSQYGVTLHSFQLKLLDE